MTVTSTRARLVVDLRPADQQRPRAGHAVERALANHGAEALERTGHGAIGGRGEAVALQDADAVGLLVAEAGELQADDFVRARACRWAARRG